MSNFGVTAGVSHTAGSCLVAGVWNLDLESTASLQHLS